MGNHCRVCRLKGLKLMGTFFHKTWIFLANLYHHTAIPWRSIRKVANRHSSLHQHYETRVRLFHPGTRVLYETSTGVNREMPIYAFRHDGRRLPGVSRSPGWKPEPPWKAQQQGSSFVQGPKQKLSKTSCWNLKMRVFENESPFSGVNFHRLELVVFGGCAISSSQDKLKTLHGTHTDQMW